MRNRTLGPLSAGATKAVIEGTGPSRRCRRSATWAGLRPWLAAAGGIHGSSRKYDPGCGRMQRSHEERCGWHEVQADDQNWLDRFRLCLSHEAPKVKAWGATSPNRIAALLPISPHTLMTASDHFSGGMPPDSVSRPGFIGIEPPQIATQRQSIVMVAAAGLGVVWGFAFAGSALVAVAIPVMILFGLRRLLIARIADEAGSANGVVAVGAGSAVWAGAGTDEA